MKLVKFFPAETSGGVDAVKALSAPFPNIKFIPTGGISMSNIKEYLQLPCVAACGGSWMVQEKDIDNGNFSEITQKSRLAAEALKGDDSMPEIITFGEPMVVYMAEEPGSFQEVSHYSRGLAGAELNFAIGVTRLGHRASYFTKLGKDPYGDYIRSFIEKEGVDGNNLIFDSRYLSGSYVKTKVNDGDPEVFYFRKNSAASHIGSEDVKHLQFKGARLFHLTGITPALSKQCRAASIEAVQKAKLEKVTVMFDPNIREALWDSNDEMRDTLNTLAFESDIFLPGIKEGRLLTGLREPHEIADYYLKRGTGAVIIKLGAEGAYFKIKTEKSIYNENTVAGTSGTVFARASEGLVPGFKPDKIVDTVGAGDAFAAGVACAVLEGLPLEDAVAAGNAMGAIIISSQGDNDNLPDKERLQNFMRRQR